MGVPVGYVRGGYVWVYLLVIHIRGGYTVFVSTCWLCKRRVYL
jgi:hypothetical protein